MFHWTLMLREEAVGSMSFRFHTLCMYRRRAMERIVGMISPPPPIIRGVTVLCVRSRHPMNSLSCTVRKSVWASLLLWIWWRHIGMSSFFFACSRGCPRWSALSFIIWIFCLVHYKNQSILHDTISGHPYIPKSLNFSALVLKTADNTNTASSMFVSAHDKRRQNFQRS
jgi:hypothetical protein